MNEELYEAISRLKAWIRDYGHEKQPEFIRDLETVIGMFDSKIEASPVLWIDGSVVGSIAAIEPLSFDEQAEVQS